MLGRSLFLFLCSLLFCLWFSPLSIAQTPADQQVQTGVELYQTGQTQEAIAQWQQALSTYKNTGNLNHQAIVLENLARATQQIGQTSQALDYWASAIQVYRQLNNKQQIGRSLTEQAQAHSRLGQYREAIALLCGNSSCQAGSAIAIAQSLNDQPGEVAALGSLGDVYRLKGDYPNAIKTLEEALEMARSLNHSPFLVATLNSLGNTYISQAQIRYQRANSAKLAGDVQDARSFTEKGLELDRKALVYLKESMAVAESSTQPSDQPSENTLGKTRAFISIIPVLYHVSDPSVAELLQEAIALTKTLPNSSDKVYALLDLTRLLYPEQSNPTFSKIDCPATESPLALGLLEMASASAQEIQDERSQSFALGELGRLYECRGDIQTALELTQKARIKAEQNLRAKDSLYLWEWQTGRILSQQGDELEAIAAYDQAVNTLEEIRNDLLSANRDLQFDFRDTVSPLYRQLIALRLESESLSPPSSHQNKSRSNLSSVLQTLDSLRLAELQNYFGNDCVIRSVRADNNRSGNSISGIANTISDPTAAIFSSIILNDKIAIVVSFPDGTQRLEPIEVDSVTLSATVNQYRTDLEKFYIDFDSTSAQKIYRWIIEPFAEELKQNKIETLVFIQDGILRSVPMSALFNPETKKYLIEDYAIAITPSLNLTDPTSFNRKQLRVLTLGLRQAALIDGQDYDPLTSVEAETLSITTEIPGSKRLMDGDFTIDNLKKELDKSSYSILHIATHGKFGTDANETFLVTGDQEKLTINKLDEILRQTKGEPIELLTLTACETAIGDDRSALGLAGVAIQAGAKSAIATLWSVNDQATGEIAAQFYAILRNNPSMSKAKALQAAQVAVINKGGQDSRPSRWSPFILIGNWL